MAIAQIAVTQDIDQNTKTIERAIEKAMAQQADILLTPEGSLSGYTPRFDQQQVEASLNKIVKKASSAGLALALGTCFVEPDDGKCYNQLRFYDGEGNFLGFHSKTLRCGTMTTPSQGEINDYAVRPLRTFKLKGITVGGLICNDMWANPMCTPMPDPHLSQQLSDMGARIIFQAINGGRDGNDWSRNVFWPFHETNLRIRADRKALDRHGRQLCARRYPLLRPQRCAGPQRPLGGTSTEPGRARAGLYDHTRSGAETLVPYAPILARSAHPCDASRSLEERLGNTECGVRNAEWKSPPTPAVAHGDHGAADAEVRVPKPHSAIPDRSRCPGSRPT